MLDYVRRVDTFIGVNSGHYALRRELPKQESLFTLRAQVGALQSADSPVRERRRCHRVDCAS